MNDFTKEELQALFKCIRLTEMEHGECSDLDNLKFKIQPMIDNYCEHTPSDSYYEQFRWQLCAKCGVQYK